MSIISIDKDIYLRDQYGVKRREWVAGQKVASYVYHAVLKTNTAINPEDLPVEPKLSSPSLNTGIMENKMLPEEVEASETMVEEKPKTKAIKTNKGKK